MGVTTAPLPQCTRTLVTCLQVVVLFVSAPLFAVSASTARAGGREVSTPHNLFLSRGAPRAAGAVGKKTDNDATPTREVQPAPDILKPLSPKP